MTHAVVLLLVAAVPIPPAKPGLTKDEEALLRSAEADVEAARPRLLAPAPSRGPDAAEAARRLRLRAACERLDRLAASLTGRSNKAKARVARAAADAWWWADEHARALPHYERALRLGAGACALDRAATLWHAWTCCDALGRTEEAARYRGLYEAEAAKLPRSKMLRA